jgi:hypothetical protein
LLLLSLLFLLLLLHYIASVWISSAVSLTRKIVLLTMDKTKCHVKSIQHEDVYSNVNTPGNTYSKYHLYQKQNIKK